MLFEYFSEFLVPHIDYKLSCWPPSPPPTRRIRKKFKMSIGRIGPMTAERPYAWQYGNLHGRSEVLNMLSEVHLAKKKLLSREDFSTWKTGQVLSKHLVISYDGNTIDIKHKLFDAFQISIPSFVWRSTEGGTYLVPGRCCDLSQDETIADFWERSKKTLMGSILETMDSCTTNEALDIYLRYRDKCDQALTDELPKTPSKDELPKTPSKEVTKTPSKKRKQPGDVDLVRPQANQANLVCVDTLLLSGVIPSSDPRRETLEREITKEEKTRKQHFLEASIGVADVANIVLMYAEEENTQCISTQKLDYKDPTNHKCQMCLQHNPKTGQLRVDCRYHLQMYLKFNLYALCPSLNKKSF